MSARLRLVSLWMPRRMMDREVERIRARTDAALDALLAVHAPGAAANEEDGPGLDTRAAMARGHERRVRALIDAVGREKAIALGREALYPVGVALGREARGRLAARDTLDDLVRAAGVMYRVLGIEFSMASGPEGRRMVVSRCALSRHYSPEACMMLSAVDEGAVSGLCPRAAMRFTERITDGSPCCVATVEMREGA